MFPQDNKHLVLTQKQLKSSKSTKLPFTVRRQQKVSSTLGNQAIIHGFNSIPVKTHIRKSGLKVMNCEAAKNVTINKGQGVYKDIMQKYKSLVKPIS